MSVPWLSFDDKFQSDLQEEIKSCEQAILSGSTRTDFDRYAMLTGKRQGLLMAQQMYLDALKKFEEAH